MSEVRGRYITSAGFLMSLYPKQRVEADRLLYAQTGKHFYELEPEGWYDTKWIKLFLDKYVEASPSGDNALITFGRKIYPAIKSKLPEHLKTPLDYLRFETEGYVQAHKGPDVRPRKILIALDGEFIVQALVPQWHNSKMYEGVFLGILEMCGVKTGKVTKETILESKESIVEFHVTW
ncbi:MAG: hypothetical protein HC831_21130 [Chloroflexia bacterium]|nr:hypothetical protein [Chloroflexia bacterium]